MQATTIVRRVPGRRVLGAIVLSGALALTAGCHSKSAAASGPDPADANMASPNGQTQVLGQNAAYTPQQQGESYPQQAPAPVEQNYPQQQGYYAQQPSDQEVAGEEALEDTTQAPPPLPDYEQPEAPGPDYIWTPGYWAWGPGGYYWVPGSWVLPPYYGALWTPPYWGWYNGGYRFHPGYWGRHIGYYGGIDYGFGYIGIGYFGGYWSGNHFYYNTAVNRVNPDVHTIYQRPVVYNNVHYGVQPRNRVSYNGGHGGINVQPRPAEVAAMHEAHTAALPAQRQMRVEAGQNRAQFYNDNHGRPAMASAAHPVAENRAIAPAPRGAEPAPAVRPGQPNGAYVNERAANNGHPQPYEAPRGENRPAPAQPNAPHYENRATPQPQPNAGNAHFENRAQPQPNAPRYEHQPSPQPQPRVENRPQPQPREEAPRPESRPAPAPRPQAHAAPQGHPAPQTHGGNDGHEEHGHR